MGILVCFAILNMAVAHSRTYKRTFKVRLMGSHYCKWETCTSLAIHYLVEGNPQPFYLSLLYLWNLCILCLIIFTDAKSFSRISPDWRSQHYHWLLQDTQSVWSPLLQPEVLLQWLPPAPATWNKQKHWDFNIIGLLQKPRLWSWHNLFHVTNQWKLEH